jgi:uncharacterized membrane protein YccC
MEQPRPSLTHRLTRRALAILVLAIAAWILLKFVIGLIAGVATLIVVVVAVLAVLWAVNQL